MKKILGIDNTRKQCPGVAAGLEIATLLQKGLIVSVVASV